MILSMLLSAVFSAVFSILGKRISAAGATTGDIKAETQNEDATRQGSTLPPGATVSSAARLPAPDFAGVYDEYFGFVWRNVLNRGIPRSSVDDVVQEIFIVVHRKLPEFEGRSSLRTWLAGIARRVVSDHVRKRGNAPVGDPLDVDFASALADPAEALDTKVAARLVDGLLALMSEEQREVFMLHELEEMTGREIAESTGTNENTVHTRLRAARKIFQEGLARLEESHVGIGAR
jgi:RNA polymerase sigma-70 factor (ECF subfamily)